MADRYAKPNASMGMHSFETPISCGDGRSHYAEIFARELQGPGGGEGGGRLGSNCLIIVCLSEPCSEQTTIPRQAIMIRGSSQWSHTTLLLWYSALLYSFGIVFFG